MPLPPNRETVGVPITLAVMATFSTPVSHMLQRAQALRGLKAGTRRQEELCDASFLLSTAAQFHGTQAGRTCPVCASDELKEVLWVHGEELGRASNTARTHEEILRMADAGAHFEVHTVEVCPACRWNHILVARSVGPDEKPK